MKSNTTDELKDIGQKYYKFIIKHKGYEGHEGHGGKSIQRRILSNPYIISKSFGKKINLRKDKCIYKICL